MSLPWSTRNSIMLVVAVSTSHSDLRRFIQLRLSHGKALDGGVQKRGASQCLGSFMPGSRFAGSAFRLSALHNFRLWRSLSARPSARVMHNPSCPSAKGDAEAGVLMAVFRPHPQAFRAVPVSQAHSLQQRRLPSIAPLLESLYLHLAEGRPYRVALST